MSAESTIEPTGIPALDPIVGGGLPHRGIVFVVGGPGTGKTVLVQQLMFAAARRGQPALYFSGLSEPHERLVEHLRPFAFFDEQLLAQRLQLLSLTAGLEQGADAAVDVVIQTVRRTDARLVIVDGFLGLRGLMEVEREAPRFLYQLGAQIGLLGALLVVVLEGDPATDSFRAELPLGDVILALSCDDTQPSARRSLRVLKRRGAAPLPGLHAFTIGPAGITCYPQVESVVHARARPFNPADRTAFGLPELDAMVNGGLTQQTMTLVAGSPGVGKTLLGLQFLAAGVARGEPGLLLGFHESCEQLLAKAAQHDIDLAGAVESGAIRLLVQPPIALDPDILAQVLQEAVLTGGVQRLVVDSVAELELAVPRSRVTPYLAALATFLRGQGVTAVLTKEFSRGFSLDVDFTELPISVFAENVLLLRHIPIHSEMHRIITVLKMRFSDYDRSLREYTIDARGLRVLGRWESGREVLDALADRDEARGATTPPPHDQEPSAR